MNPAAVNPENRALSSVFVANIPQDVSEELLKELFSEVGLLLNLRVFLDKSSNKAKVAFCEFKDPETALRAVRSLNGLDIKGQPLIVDLATSEKCRQELERLQGSIEASLDAVDSTDKAPEEISKAVASLPAEQMFELMKQMKMCIENNPQEARNLLLQNPQLAYALLQAQVIMRIVDPNVAMKILNRPTAPPVNSEVKSEAVPESSDVSEVPPTFPTGTASVKGDSEVVDVPASVPRTGLGPVPGLIPGGIPGPVPPVRQPGMSMMPGSANAPGISSRFADQDLRTLGPTIGDQDLRTLPTLGVPDRDMRAPQALLGIDKDMRLPMGDQDLRTLGVPPTTVTESRPFDPRFRNMQSGDRNVVPGFERPRADPRTTYDPRNPGASSRVEDPRKASMATSSLNSRLSAVGLGPNPSMGPASMIPDEQEKAALIMQVLQLTEQQISALPPEQRQSIMVLKEQLARTQMI